MKHRVFVSLLFLALELSTFCFPTAQIQRKALPYRFLIPEGYVGWIRVDFNVPGTPELPIENGYYVFKFSESGRLETSSSDVLISRRDQFFYYSGAAQYQLEIAGPMNKRMVQDEFSGPGPGHPAPLPNRYRYIFIGPRDVFEKHRATDRHLSPKEQDGYPKVGAQTWLTREDLIRLNVRLP